ncbi:hypothetical protein B9Z55_022116 [Caenorhabditis nigoni]|uniref:Uncharacterized protein n=1 Tax=Caenorhabditis nigoni TaxID=1611254 RepID=A0A2G5TV16_9PELO|nr:hypothetical protein B9Z55_022116 [Caenorhabditis nigoni]
MDVSTPNSISPAPKRVDHHCYDSIDEDCATSGAPSPCSSSHGSTNSDVAVTHSTSPRPNAPRTRRSMRNAATFDCIPEQEPFYGEFQEKLTKYINRTVHSVKGHFWVTNKPLVDLTLFFQSS